MTCQDRFEIVAPPAVTAPLISIPAGAVDAHSHVFGPFDRFPPRHASVYALPAALPAAHAAMRAGVGIRHGLLVQPAPYGDDPAAMLAAIAASDGALRGVAVARPEIADETLAAWKAQGIVGLRFVEMRAPNGKRYPGSIGFDALHALAPRMRQHGLHAQLWASADQYAGALPALCKLGVPLVLDHMGSPEISRGIDDPAFTSLLGQLRSGDIWVKLTISRFFDAGPDFADLRPFHDALLQAAPDRLLWGSDWPYVRLDPAPDVGAMLDLFADWTGNPDLRQRILVRNPALLYGFARSEGEVR